MSSVLTDAKSYLSARLSLAARVAIITTVAVGLTLAAVSTIVYVTVRGEFEQSLDKSLLRRANTAATQTNITELTIAGTNTAALVMADIQVAVVRGGDFRVFSSPSALDAKPYIGIHEREVALGYTNQSVRTVTLAGREQYRVVAVKAGDGNALVLAQSLESAQRALARLYLVLWLASAAGVAVAGVTGWLVATRGLRPVRRLTEAAERVARTEELTPIPVSGADELARLTTSFNSMLLALDASQTRQRQLVADAGHELRTPLTSLRTNIELLSQSSQSSDRKLSARQSNEIMTDVQAQLSELTTLVGDLVELAREEPLRRDPEPADLAAIVESAVDRVRLRAPGLTIDVTCDHWLVVGEPHMLERAVTNILDNAVKWSPPLGTVRVVLADGVLTVADEGPGIRDSDLPHIFDRFYRSPEARTLPGSGLGLSIVRRTAERHGGTIEATRGPDGGTIMTMKLPGST
ncbi:MAG: two-component sensor histidine kinase [Nocardioidaceae bacterium]|nr:two-component sensor histidine kinase [Nocardioidaceae bacterium]